MFESEKKSPLDRVKKSLYSRRDVFGESPRHDIRGPRVNEVKTSWDKPEEPAPVDNKEAILESGKPPVRRGYKIFLLSSLAFLFIALAVGTYTLFGGKNFISVDNIDILIDGPVSVAGGSPFSLNVSVLNKNTTEIQSADLIAEYPAGTKDQSDPTKDLSRVRVSLGNVNPSEVVQRTLGSIMFGEENAARQVKFTVEYRTADSNAIFRKEKNYNLNLSSSPVLVSFDTPERVLSNQPTDLNITVSSNASSPIKDLLLILDYPFGFSISSSNPSPTFGNNIWNIGDLAPGAKKTIAINASVQGEDGEARAVHAKVGIRSESDDRSIATNIITGTHTFMIERPSLGLEVNFDGEKTDDFAVESGSNVRTDLVWTNNSSTRITNARIEATLSGNALDKNTINVQGGYYNSINNTIVWEAGRTVGLDSIAPGESNRVTFSFNTSRPILGQTVKNPTVTVSVTASGSRIDESGVSEGVSSGVSRSVKVISNLALSARALRNQGPIANTGPIPPKADQESTYTVVWTVTNTSNNISGTQVTATIPAYMRWTGVVSPADANISYNSVGGIITWMAGNIPANSDIGTGAKQVSFQLGLTPNINQVGTTPEIMSESIITGLDAFANTTIRNRAPSLSTRTTTDLYWKPGDETVTN